MKLKMKRETKIKTLKIDYYKSFMTSKQFEEI